MLNLINKIFGDPVKKEIERLGKIVDKINNHEEKLSTLTDEQLKDKTSEFKSRLINGETLDDLLPEAFAVVKNACRRLCGKEFSILKHQQKWEMVPYDVQMIGGIVLHEGKIAEMRTGEGKTLVATLPSYLNALSGKGVHLVTVNDYLAKRDAEWMKPIFDFLGMSVGVILHELNNDQRREAYQCDVTYGTNNEYGFDFLRDSMAPTLESMVQRKLNFAIVDEVDSILIDEARTPLIISQPAEESTSKYIRYSRLVTQLQENVHYNIDEKQKSAILSEEGIKKMEELMNVQNIYTDAGFVEVRHIEQALRAMSCYKKDKDYVVKDGEVIIVDEFTGRLMSGRRYSEGLHQAIEAKEGVEIKRESKTMATITFQNYFRIYDKLSGMTGTAITEAEEFAKIYNLEVLPIPTFKNVIRDDKKDLVFKNERGKFQAIANIVKEKYQKGQPVLIGTISIEKSETLSSILQKNDVPHAVLNAKHHEKEAEIITNAGQKGAITIATNMAGRGTDIKLGSDVADLGGLFILGSERHESRRIDNQLRGRAGRQGDPGESQFYVSLEDPLMRLFGNAEFLQNMMNNLNIPDDMPIESSMVSGSIESAQKKVEGRNFDIRKHLVEFDDVTNKHREIINKKRLKILKNNDLNEDIIKIIKDISKEVVNKHTLGKPHEWDYKEIYETISAIHADETSFSIDKIQELQDQTLIVEVIDEYLLRALEEKRSMLPDPQKFSEVEKYVLLKTIDSLWPEHIDAMSHLREVVSLRGYAQRDPLIEYQQEGFERFKNLLREIEDNAINMLYKLKIQIQIPSIENASIQAQQLKTNANEIESTSQQVFSKQPNVQVVKSNMDSANKTGRNEPCPCGSGKKFKKCCG